MLNDMAAKNMPEAFVGQAHLARDGTPPDYNKAFSLYQNNFLNYKKRFSICTDIKKLQSWEAQKECTT